MNDGSPPSAQPPLVSVFQLSKRFSGAAALEQLDFSLYPGEVMGLLGPNGAGKTTTLKLLLGLLRPSTGHAQIMGLDSLRDALRVKTQVGFMPDEPQFYDHLSGRETLDFLISVRGLDPAESWSRLEAILHWLDLGSHLDAFTNTYSLGTKKKLALLCAVLHRPRVLLLDEPTNGLDPPTAQRVRELLREEASRGAAVLLSTHLLDMADRLCDRVLVLHRGRQVALGTSREVRDQAGVDPAATLEDAFFKLVGP
jgi:ABC-2 type transport system ATP-binding protein